MPSRARTRAPVADHLSRFLSVLHRTPIPTAPPPHDAYQEALGLNLLALALRLEHIDRMTEALTLADSTHMARSVSVDIDTNVLTPEQRFALRSDPGGVGGRPSVWLPVSRQSRSDMAPVVVRDAAGNVVPRMPQVETAQALIHGMCKAFRMFLTSDQRTEDPDEVLHAVKRNANRSRWLIEATIGDMIAGGVRPGSPVPPYGSRRAPDPLRQHPRQGRPHRRGALPAGQPVPAPARRRVPGVPARRGGADVQGAELPALRRSGDPRPVAEPAGPQHVGALGVVPPRVHRPVRHAHPARGQVLPRDPRGAARDPGPPLLHDERRRLPRAAFARRRHAHGLRELRPPPRRHPEAARARAAGHRLPARRVRPPPLPRPRVVPGLHRGALRDVLRPCRRAFPRGTR